jgi:hypothetical protein
VRRCRRAQDRSTRPSRRGTWRWRVAEGTGRRRSWGLKLRRVHGSRPRRLEGPSVLPSPSYSSPRGAVKLSQVLFVVPGVVGGGGVDRIVNHHRHTPKPARTDATRCSAARCFRARQCETWGLTVVQAHRRCGAATFIVGFVARSSGVAVAGEDGYRRPRDGQPPQAWFTCFESGVGRARAVALHELPPARKEERRSISR